MKTNVFAVGMFAMVLSGSSMAASVVKDSTGKITGINGVSVNNQQWNVTFSNTWDNKNYGVAFANAATQALFGLIDKGGELSGSMFDYKPGSILGCDTGFNGFVCNITTVGEYLPEQTIYKFSYLNNYWNFSSASDQAVINQSNKYTSPFSNSDVGTLASWSQVSAVPVPAAAFMFAPALLGFLGFRRKNWV